MTKTNNDNNPTGLADIESLLNDYNLQKKRGCEKPQYNPKSWLSKELPYKIAHQEKEKLEYFIDMVTQVSNYLKKEEIFEALAILDSYKENGFSTEALYINSALKLSQKLNNNKDISNQEQEIFNQIINYCKSKAPNYLNRGKEHNK